MVQVTLTWSRTKDWIAAARAARTGAARQLRNIVLAARRGHVPIPLFARYRDDHSRLLFITTINCAEEGVYQVLGLCMPKPSGEILRARHPGASGSAIDAVLEGHQHVGLGVFGSLAAALDAADRWLAAPTLGMESPPCPCGPESRP